MTILSVNAFGQSFFSTNTGDTIWYTYAITTGKASVTAVPSGSNRYSGSLVIPDTVSYSGRTFVVSGINYNAFRLCSGLNEISLPHTIKTIASNVFQGCTNLVKTNFRGTIAQWCDIVFNDRGSNPISYSKNLYINDTLITQLHIPSNVLTIPQYAFYYDTALLDVIIDSGVTEIKARAFGNCRKMHDITLGKTLNNVSDYAFDSCTGLLQTNFSGSIGEWCNISFGGLRANPVYFSKNLYINNQLLTALTIPNNVKGIKDYSFINCLPLTSVVFGDSVIRVGISAFYGCNNISSVSFDTILKTIGASAFNQCSSITEITIPKNTDSIGSNAFFGCSGIHFTRFSGTLEEWCRIRFYSHYSNPMYYSRNLYINNQSFGGTLHIPASITRILGYSFENCDALTSVIMHDSVSDIGSNAFSGCINLTQVSFSDSLWTIGVSSFQNCINMVPSRFPSKVQYIGTGAFEQCKALDIDMPQNVAVIENDAFRGCSNLRKAMLPDNLTNIGTSAFMDCTRLDSVSIGNRITNIRPNVFKNDTALRYISLGGAIQQISNSAFDNCNNLETTNYTGTIGKWCEISFGCNPVAISHNLYLNGQPLTNVVIPNNIYQIPANAFQNDTLITQLTFGSNVNSINRNAFLGCKNIVGITFKRQNSPVVDGQAFNLSYGVVTPRIPCGSSNNYNSNTSLGAWFAGYFERMVFDFDAHSNDEAKGTVNITQRPACNTPAEFTAVPRPGCTFSHWSDGDTNSSRSIYVIIDTTLTAYFSGTSGINDVDDNNFSIQQGEGTIVINTTKPQQILISDALGRILYSGKCNGNFTFKTINKGLYFVKIGDLPARKVVAN